MDITARKSRIEDEPADAVLLIHCEGERRLAPAAAAVDARLRGRLAGLITSGEFTGRLGQVSILHVAPGERLRAKRVVLAGLGKRKDVSLEKLRQAAGSAAKAIRNAGAKSFAVPAQDLARLLTSAPAVNRVRDVAQTLSEGALLGLYQFTTYRTERT
ncbi:MAG: M17 family peptidase N-terminal domain-containing protein, partial [Nitrospirota bacterium]